MYHQATAFLAICIAAGLTACSPSGRQGTDLNEETVDERADRAQETFSRTAKLRIDDMEQRMEQVAERLDEAPESIQQEMKAQVEDWQQRASDLDSRIDDFDPETPEVQREFQARVSEELDELARALNEHSQRVSPAAVR